MDEAGLIVGGAIAAGLVATALSAAAYYGLRRHNMRYGALAMARSYPSRPVSPEAQEVRCSVVVVGLIPYIYSIRIHCDHASLFLSPRQVAGQLRLATPLQSTIAIPLEHVKCRANCPFGLLRTIVIQDDQKGLYFRLLADVTPDDCSRMEGSSTAAPD